MIKLLSKETIDKIAAGEVVERPENVAKELLDNAIDSGASAISVEIRGGGIELIRVTDNGCGIAKQDIPNAFLRHATSKLTSAEDLNHIRTMGFRGEALASIAGVARVEMITRRKEDLTGTRYLIEGGNEISMKDVGVPEGTSVIVRDLFFNVPVRRQFLKQPKTEGSYVRDIVEKASLSYPEISFSFLSDGKQLFHTTGNGRLKDTVYTVYGSDVIRNMIPVSYGNETGKISGYVSKPALSRSRRDSEIYFVNGRYVRSQVIDRAVETAYEGYLMQHRFPFTILSVEIAPEYVDVNIHPKKTEVRFSDDEAVFNLVYNAVKETMSHREHIENALNRPADVSKVQTEPHLEPFETKMSVAESALRERIAEKAPEISVLKDAADHAYRPQHPDGLRNATAKDPLANRTEAEDGKPKASENVPGPEGGKIPSIPAAVKQELPEETPRQDEVYEQLRFLDPDAGKKYKFIGQVFQTYWMIEYEDALYIIDQHAAHEKVNYERLTEKIRNHEVTSQAILPVLITLNAKEAALLEEHLDAFETAGYEIESAGDKDFYVRAVPACLPELSEKEMLLNMIESLNDSGQEMKNTLLSEKIASMSCKAAVKGNRVLTEQEMRALTEELLQCRDPYHCPHGRPVMIRFSKYELDRMFKRIV